MSLSKLSQSGTVQSEQYEALHVEEISKNESEEDYKYRTWVAARAILGEFLATLVFLFVAEMSIINLSQHSKAPGLAQALAQGFIGIAVIYSFADVSGAHFNPAVTFACWIAGKTSNRRAILYVLAQLLGSIVASALVNAVAAPGMLDLLLVHKGPGIAVWQAILMEVLLTFVLVFVIFTTAFDLIPAKSQYSKLTTVDKNLILYNVSPQSKAGFAPLAIGFTIMALACTGGAISGGAFNPARVFGVACISGDFTDNWIYWVGDFTGAFVAVCIRQSYWYLFKHIADSSPILPQ